MRRGNKFINPPPGGRQQADRAPVPSPRVESTPPSKIEPLSERFPALEEQEVELAIFAPEATAVQVAGTFNNWRPEVTPLDRRGGGEWSARLKLPSGQYEYLFVVDGTWTNDPKAAEAVANPYGGFNSLLRIPLDDRTDQL